MKTSLIPLKAGKIQEKLENHTNNKTGPIFQMRSKFSRRNKSV